MKDRPKRSKRILRRLIMPVFAGLLLGILLFCLVIVPDQFRFVPELSGTAWIWEGLEDDMHVADIVETSLSPTQPEASELKDLEGKEDKKESKRDEDEMPILTEELLRKCRPVPDKAKISDASRSAAEEDNNAADKLVRDLFALASSQKDMTYEDAMHRFNEIAIGHSQIWSAWKYDISHEDQDEYSRRLWAFLDVEERVNLLISVENEKWIEAAYSCMRLQMVSRYMTRQREDDNDTWLPLKTSHWWQREIYFCRRAGLRGRAFLAYHSSAHITLPMGEALWPIVHPPLNWLEEKLW